MCSIELFSLFMISMLTGTIAHHGLGCVILTVAGVGYRVTLPESVAHGLSGEVTLYTHHAIRDDGQELFGFTTLSGLELCAKLCDVNGVGPKMAQKIVYGGRSVDEVIEKVTKGDVEFLSTIPGVGKKTAQKIILELQGKLVEVPTSVVDDEALTALMGLGYSKMQAEGALSELGKELGAEDLIRAGLKRLSRS